MPFAFGFKDLSPRVPNPSGGIIARKSTVDVFLDVSSQMKKSAGIDHKTLLMSHGNRALINSVRDTETRQVYPLNIVT
jgi:hypothetical protein